MPAAAGATAPHPVQARRRAESAAEHTQPSPASNMYQSQPDLQASSHTVSRSAMGSSGLYPQLYTEQQQQQQQQHAALPFAGDNEDDGVAGLALWE